MCFSCFRTILVLGSSWTTLLKKTSVLSIALHHPGFQFASIVGFFSFRENAGGDCLQWFSAMTCNPHVHYSLADYSKLLMRKFVVTNEAVSLALSLFHSLSISLSHSLSYLCGKSYFREEWKIVHVTNKKLFSKISFNAANKFCFSFSSCSILFPLDPGGKHYKQANVLPCWIASYHLITQDKRLGSW